MAQAGWYTDPSDKARLRRYDGTNWTDETKPATNTSVTSSTSSVVAGMYPDPTHDGQLRYFDGEAWWPLMEDNTWEPRTAATTPGRGRTTAALSHAGLFWYTVMCAMLGTGYLTKVAAATALEEAGLVVRTKSERFWYRLGCVFFGWAYFVKVPVASALEEAGVGRRSAAAKFWYAVQCAFFGSGYFAKVIVATALEEQGFMVRTSAAKFWYALSCVDFGVGYLQKTCYAKALSEIGSVDEATVVRRKWWYWPLALVVVIGYYAGYLSYVGPRLVEAAQRVVVTVDFTVASTTLNYSISTAQANVHSSDPAIRSQGYSEEALAMKTFDRSISTLSVAQSDRTMRAALVADGEVLAQDFVGARTATLTAASGRYSTKIARDSTAFNEAERTLGRALSVSAPGL